MFGEVSVEIICAGRLGRRRELGVCLFEGAGFGVGGVAMARGGLRGRLRTRLDSLLKLSGLFRKFVRHDGRLEAGQACEASEGSWMRGENGSFKPRAGELKGGPAMRAGTEFAWGGCETRGELEQECRKGQLQMAKKKKKTRSAEDN